MKNFINSYDRVKNAIESGKAINIFNLVDGDFFGMGEFEYSDEATIVLELIAKNGEGFVVDICTRVLESIKQGRKVIVLSDKQRWRIAYTAIKMNVSLVDDLRNSDQQIEGEIVKQKNVVMADSTKEGKKMLSLNDVRLINEFQESGRVFIHLFDGSTICRIMTSMAVRNAQKIRRKAGEEAFKEEIILLFNEVYNDPQQISYPPISTEDERFFELRRKLECTQSLSPEEYDEYRNLTNQQEYE